MAKTNIRRVIKMCIRNGWIRVSVQWEKAELENCVLHRTVFSRERRIKKVCVRKYELEVAIELERN